MAHYGYTNEWRRQEFQKRFADRLQKLGSIKPGQLWKENRELCNYAAFMETFADILDELVRDGKAEKIRNGLWFIHKNDFSVKPRKKDQ